MASSARCCSCSGTSRPSALVVLRLMTSPILDGNSIGRSRLGTLQNFVDINCSAPKALALINAVAREPSDLDTVAFCKDRRQPCAESKLHDVRTLDLEQPVHRHNEGLSLPLGQTVECRSEVVAHRGLPRPPPEWFSCSSPGVRAFSVPGR